MPIAALPGAASCKIEPDFTGLPGSESAKPSPPALTTACRCWGRGAAPLVNEGLGAIGNFVERIDATIIVHPGPHGEAVEFLAVGQCFCLQT